MLLTTESIQIKMWKAQQQRDECSPQFFFLVHFSV